MPDSLTERDEVTLGAIFSGARSRLGWTLRDAEKASGVPNAHISQIERGAIQRPGVPVLAKLAKAYGLPLRELTEAAGHGSDWGMEVPRKRIGYVVVEINQASGVAERMNPDLFLTREDAEECAEMDRAQAAFYGPCDRYYIVCEVFEVDGDD